MAFDRTKGEVWVFAEQEEGKLSDVPRELLGKGRELADKLGVKLAAVLLGSGVEALAAELFAAGADRVHQSVSARVRQADRGRASADRDFRCDPHGP